MQTKVLRVRVDEETYETVRRFASTKKIKVSAVIRSAIHEYLPPAAKSDSEQCPTPAEFFLADPDRDCPLCGEKRFPAHLTQAKLNKLKGSA